MPGSSSSSTSSDDEGRQSGTIHVKVLRAHNLPTLDLGKRQDPFVKITLTGTGSTATTDPAFQGGSSPEWTQNNELELFYDAKSNHKDVILKFEVFANEYGQELLGTGDLNCNEVIEKRAKSESPATVRMRDPSGSGQRGEVHIMIWYGPPVRKAFRAAGRATKLLDARDSVVWSAYGAFSSALAYIAYYLQVPREMIKRNQKISMALAALTAIIAAGIAGLFMLVAIPTTLVAAFTFPLWIIPFLVTTFFTAPLWIPVVLLAGGFIFFTTTFVFGLGVTSRPVRRRGKFVSNKFKHTDVGKRVVYEKTQ